MSRDALVVGINTYQALPGLKAPARDAEAIAQQLQIHGEFRVHRLPEVIQTGKPTVGQKTVVSLRELETALINLFKPKGSNIPQTALFYFSGHGIQREAGIREGYLALSDSQPDKGFYGLSLFWLRRLLQDSPVRQRIVILDCCHSGELLNFLEADPGARPGTDRLFMAASREYETAFESLDSPYSVFTQAILTGLNPNWLESGLVTNHSLVNCVSQALKGEIQQPLFESSGSEIVLTRRQTGDFVPPTTIQSTEICPYRGLTCFNVEDAEYFFGREALTADLIAKLKAEQFVAVVGASGIGKSSLVRAGLIAQLKQEANRQGDKQWRIKLLTPGKYPLRNLAEAFITPNLTDLERAEQVRRAESFLQEGSTGLVQLVRAALLQNSKPSGTPSQERPRMLLVIDQFEEVFTLAHSANAERDRQAFFACLLGAASLAKDFLSIVVVLRQDFLPKCDPYEELQQTIAQHQLTVTPLKYEQIKAAILRPAQKVGLVCEPHLVYTMLLDISGAPGELPLLEYTLTELWQQRRKNVEGNVSRLTLEAYQELGGIRGTLQKRATEAFQSLSPEEQAVAKRIFLALTQLGEGTEDTRRRVIKTELISPTYPTDLIEGVLEKLVAAKLLVTGQYVDVVHEALIRNWPLLRGWLQENRETIRRLRRIEEAAQEWNSVDQPSTSEYLLSGLRLRDAEDFVKAYPHELSELAQQFVAVSREATHRFRRESRQLQITVPSFLFVTLLLMVGQYYRVLQSQAEQASQLHTAIARERSAVAQSILQDNDSDPTTALLISRLAAETTRSSIEDQNSLRNALQQLRLQLNLVGHTHAVHQVAFSPDRRSLASASTDGSIRLWSFNAPTTYTNAPINAPEPTHILLWSNSENNPARHQENSVGEIISCSDRSCLQSSLTNAAAADNVTSFSFSPDGQQIAAIGQNSPTIKLWSVSSGESIAEMVGSAAVQQIVFSPNGEWLVSLHQDQTIAIWQGKTGQLLARLPQAEAVQAIQFSPNGQLLTIGIQSVQLWQLVSQTPTNLVLQPVIGFKQSANIHQASLSPSGRWVGTASTDGVARIWDLATGKLHLEMVQSKANGTSLTQVLFTPSEQTLVVADASHQVWLWDTTSGQVRYKLSSSSTVSTQSSRSNDNQPASSPLLMAMDASGRFLLTTVPQLTNHHFSNAVLWDMATGTKLGVLPGHRGAIETAQFSADGTYVATAGADGVVRLWATELGGELPIFNIRDAPVKWAMFAQPAASGHGADNGTDNGTPDGTNNGTNNGASLVTIDPKGQLQRWQVLNHPSATVSATAASRSVSTPTFQATQNIGQRLWTLLNRPLQRLTTLASDNQVPPPPQRVLPQTSPQLLVTSLDPATPANIPPGFTLSSVAISRDGQWLATASMDGIVQVSQLQADQSTKQVYQIQNWRSVSPETVPSQVVSNSLSVPQTSLPTSLPAGLEASRWQMAAITPSQGNPVNLRSLAFSRDGRYLLAVADDFTVRLWDAQTGNLLQVLRGHTATIQQAQFSPDGERIITASWDRTVRIWSVASGELLKTLPHADAVNSAAFSPDRQRVVTASWDGSIQVFDALTGKQQLWIQQAQAGLSAEFSPDGESIVSAHTGGIAYLWNAHTGQRQAELSVDRTHTEPVVQASFSPDGQYVATLTQSGKVQFWAASWEMLLQIAQARSLRQLTPEECSRYLNLSAVECPVLAE